MGNKTKSNGRSSYLAASHKRFPLGELARKRKELKEKFLGQNATLRELQKDTQKLSKRVRGN